MTLTRSSSRRGYTFECALTSECAPASQPVPHAPPTLNVQRILIAGYGPPPWGGESIHVKQSADLLRHRGIPVEVLNLNLRAAPSSGYTTCRGRWELLRTLFTLAAPRSLLHLHTVGHNWKSWIIIGAAGVTARLRGIGAALTVHSGLFPHYVRGFGPIRRWLAGWVLKSFERIVCVNDDIHRSMECLRIGTPRTVVISPFLALPRTHELSACDQNTLRRLTPLIVVVAGGDSDPELGLPIVVHACNKLLAEMPSLGVVFLGSRVGKTVLPLIKTHGLSANAICLGEVPHERCLSLIRAADVVVRSTFADGDSLAVREALAFGVPVIASDTACRPPGVTLFRTGDGDDLHRSLRRQLSTQPIASAPFPLQPDHSADQLWDVYVELAGRKGSALNTGNTTYLPHTVVPALPQYGPRTPGGLLTLEGCDELRQRAAEQSEEIVVRTGTALV
jgi:glycogen(starch) synthase